MISHSGVSCGYPQPEPLPRIGPRGREGRGAVSVSTGYPDLLTRREPWPSPSSARRPYVPDTEDLFDLQPTTGHADIPVWAEVLAATTSTDDRPDETERLATGGRTEFGSEEGGRPRTGGADCRRGAVRQDSGPGCGKGGRRPPFPVKSMLSSVPVSRNFRKAGSGAPGLGPERPGSDAAATFSRAGGRCRPAPPRPG
jgi:hypothetical protein